MILNLTLITSWSFAQTSPPSQAKPEKAEARSAVSQQISEALEKAKAPVPEKAKKTTPVKKVQQPAKKEKSVKKNKQVKAPATKPVEKKEPAKVELPKIDEQTKTETAKPAPAVETPAAIASAAAPAAEAKPKPTGEVKKTPVKKEKPTCVIDANEGYTSISFGTSSSARRVTPWSANFEVVKDQLKQFVDNKVCKFKKQTCSIIARSGETTISIDDNPISPYNKDSRFTAQDLKIIKESQLCEYIEPTFSILNLEDRFAVYIDGNRAMAYSANEEAARKDLALFNETLSKSLPVTSPQTVSAQAQINGFQKLKNFECWKGATSGEQDKNKLKCERKMKSNQICETSKFLHDGNIFDVCLQGFEVKPNVVVSCFKGTNATQKKNNLKKCRESLSTGQICESNWTILGQSWPAHNISKFDVCIME